MSLNQKLVFIFPSNTSHDFTSWLQLELHKKKRRRISKLEGLITLNSCSYVPEPLVFKS